MKIEGQSFSGGSGCLALPDLSTHSGSYSRSARAASAVVLSLIRPNREARHASRRRSGSCLVPVLDALGSFKA